MAGICLSRHSPLSPPSGSPPGRGFPGRGGPGPLGPGLRPHDQRAGRVWAGTDRTPPQGGVGRGSRPICGHPDERGDREIPRGELPGHQSPGVCLRGRGTPDDIRRGKRIPPLTRGGLALKARNHCHGA